MPRHRIRHAVRQVHARVPEPHAGVRRRQQHVRARLIVCRILDRAHEELRDHPQRLHRPDVAHRVRSLIRRPQRRALRPRPAGERHRGIRLDRVAQDVQAARGRDLRRHRARVLGIQIAERRLQPAVGDAGLGVHPLQIEDASRRSFRCRSPRSSESPSAASTVPGRAGPCRSAGSRSRESRREDTWCRGSRPWRYRSSSRRRRRRTHRTDARARTRSHRGTIPRSARHERGRRARMTRRSARATRARSGRAAAGSTTGSVITSTRPAPISFRSMPTSRVTPTPKRTLETAISNAVSLFMLVDMCPHTIPHSAPPEPRIACGTLPR